MSKAALPYIEQKALLRKKWIKTKRSKNCSKLHFAPKVEIAKSANPNDIQVDLSNPNCSTILREIVNLTIQYSTTGSAPRYSDELKYFAYSIYCISPSAYRTIKKEFQKITSFLIFKYHAL